MSEKLLHIRVLSPKGKLFSGDVKFAVLPGEEGPFAIYPMHAPIISSLREGKIRCMPSSGEERTIEIKSGFAEVSNDRVTACVEQ